MAPQVQQSQHVDHGCWHCPLGCSHRRHYWAHSRSSFVSLAHAGTQSHTCKLHLLSRISDKAVPRYQQPILVCERQAAYVFSVASDLLSLAQIARSGHVLAFRCLRWLGNRIHCLHRFRDIFGEVKQGKQVVGRTEMFVCSTDPASRNPSTWFFP